MSYFTSKHESLPTRSKLLESAGVPQSLLTDDLPFQKLDKSSYEYQYLNTLHSILKEGHVKTSRPGQLTLMRDDVQIVVDISEGSIPVLYSRFTAVNSACKEMIWFVSGSTDVEALKENSVHVWDEWVKPATAEFERLQPGENMRPNETMNYLRCTHPQTYKEARNWQADKVIARMTKNDIQEFLESPSNTRGIPFGDYLYVKLVSGDVGQSAYGAQWRHWNDVRIVSPHGEMAKNLKERGYKVIGMTPGLANYNSQSSFGRQLSPGENTIFSKEFDQLSDAIELIKNNPDNRRIVVNAYDPSKLADCQLPWCHYSYVFNTHINETTGERELTLRVNFRSSDFALGGVFNIAQYSFLAHMVAHVTGIKATKIVFAAADCHIYEDQLPFVEEQLRSEIKPVKATVLFHKEASHIDDIGYNDFTITGYTKADSAGVINYPVAV